MGNRTSYACVSDHSQCLNSTNGPGYICQCSPGYQGNPYLVNGCQDINECQNQGTCRRGAVCTNTPGNYSCACPPGTTGDPYAYGCDKIRDGQIKSSAVLGVSLGISGGLGMLLLLVGIMFMRKRMINKSVQQQRKTCHKNNHELLLKHLEWCNQDESIISRIKFFSLKDLEKATNDFDLSRIVGIGGHGTVYKGLLDLQVVAIKKSKKDVEIEKHQFINEVILLSQISHRNVVKLLGCCLEFEVPILVYEFISNGTLATHLHLCSQEKPFSWDNRLRVATEIASALAYMHTKANVSIYHRDIKSSNILLDDSLTAKVSDFGASRTVSMDQTHISTNIQGTFGYLDPEYLHTGRLTEKSDVYSLGVIIVELITGKKPDSVLIPRDESNLVSHFTESIKNGKLFQVVDALILEEANTEELEVVAKLAMDSLCLRGHDRPTMKEVELTLEGLMKGRKTKQKHLNYVNSLEDRNPSHEVAIYMERSMASECMNNETELEEKFTCSQSLAR